MSDGMGREPTYLSSHVTNRYFIPNWVIDTITVKGRRLASREARTGMKRWDQFPTLLL